jgi:hypothetical protein
MSVKVWVTERTSDGHERSIEFEFDSAADATQIYGTRLAETLPNFAQPLQVPGYVGAESRNAYLDSKREDLALPPAPPLPALPPAALTPTYQFPESLVDKDPCRIYASPPPPPIFPAPVQGEMAQGETAFNPPAPIKSAAPTQLKTRLQACTQWAKQKKPAWWANSALTVAVVVVALAVFTPTRSLLLKMPLLNNAVNAIDKMRTTPTPEIAPSPKPTTPVKK